MSATAQIEVYGLKEALKELRNVDPELRKTINKEAKELAKPAIDDAKASYPPRMLSGMERAWTQRGNQKFPYSQQKAQRGVGVKSRCQQTQFQHYQHYSKRPSGGHH